MRNLFLLNHSIYSLINDALNPHHIFNGLILTNTLAHLRFESLSDANNRFSVVTSH